MGPFARAVRQSSGLNIEPCEVVPGFRETLTPATGGRTMRKWARPVSTTVSPLRPNSQAIPVRRDPTVLRLSSRRRGPGVNGRRYAGSIVAARLENISSFVLTRYIKRCYSVMRLAQQPASRYRSGWGFRLSARWKRADHDDRAAELVIRAGVGQLFLRLPSSRSMYAFRHWKLPLCHTTAGGSCRVLWCEPLGNCLSLGFRDAE